MAGTKGITYASEILALIQAVVEPKQVVVMHCLSYQKLDTGIV
jgi:hypothetical protein